MAKLRTGVIGLGIGRHHVKGFQAHPNAEVVAVADTEEQRLATVADANDVPRRYLSGEEMLREEQLDVVCIATPNKLHKDLTVAAFRSGAHVLCEKPMAMNAAEAREMLEASRRAGRRLMINFSYRFSPEAQALKARVEEGCLGHAYFGRTVWHRRRGIPGFGGWFCQKELSGGGPLIDLGVHRIDLALWLMGYPKPAWVLASTYNHLGSALAAASGKQYDVEDLAVALVRFENGATLEVEASWAANLGERELMETRILGTAGGLVHRNAEEGYGFEAELYTERGGYQFDEKLHPMGSQVQSAIHHFVDCIVNDRPHIATGEEGLIVMELLDAIYESAEKGEPVRIGASS